jgi:hypothetical protein
MQIDINNISDPTELKAMAYDQIAAKEQAENTLAAINNRLRQVLNQADQVGAVVENLPIASDEELGIEDDSTDSDEVE